MQSQMGKILEIVSELAVGQRRIETRLGSLEGDVQTLKTDVQTLKTDVQTLNEKVQVLNEKMVVLENKVDQVIDHSVSNYDVNRQQDKRIDRIEGVLKLAPLNFS